MAFPDGTADFRSDTVTRPTDEMRRAMAEAPVGDDVYSDDPTVNSLEEESAAVVGKQGAVFVPSGTMGNQLAVMVQTAPGDEVLVDERAHIRNVERGWGPAYAGIGWRTVPTDGGRILASQVDQVMELAGTMFPRVTLLAWENTHNLSGGRVVPLDVVSETSRRARLHGLGVHIDGARIFNAAAATGTKAAEFAAAADTIQFCFSKGLGAPVGSIVCGDVDLMGEVRYRRKRLGGGMRQAGVIAAAARIALRDRERLSEDHDLARYLAAELADRWPGTAEPARVESNIVPVAVASLPAAFADVRDALASSGVVTAPAYAGTWRLVTHRDVDRADVDRLIAGVAGVAAVT
ncbi:MAG TPA: GntG family PLP-dependent aldolase [Acidimicrobiia bacterium]|nr:GntG family PLP-dependent aldolase [Acidimicrobiia bacterium]